MKVAVATPRCGPPSWRYHQSMVLWALHQAATDVETEILFLGRSLPIDVARNLLVKRFLKGTADYMWCVDQDAVFVPGTLDRLLSRKQPILSALEMMRLPEVCYPMALRGPRGEKGFRILAPEVYTWMARNMTATHNEPQLLTEAPDDALLAVGFTGCHCLLIRRDVLEAMEEPWFQGFEPGGEDQYFCDKAAAMGIKTYVDLSVLVGHATTDRVIGALDFMAGHYFLGMKKEAEQQEAAAEMVEWGRT